MQLTDIRTEIRLRAGLAANDQYFTDAALLTLINAGLRRISLLQDWPWLEDNDTINTVAGSSVLALTGARKVRWVQNDDREIRYINYRDLTMAYGREGRPQFYTEDSGVYHLLPTPDSFYPIQVGYIVDTDGPLVAGTDEPLLPTWATDLLISDVCVLVSRRGRDRELERVFYSEFSNVYATLVDEIAQTTEGFTPRRTKDGGYSRIVPV